MAKKKITREKTKPPKEAPAGPNLDHLAEPLRGLAVPIADLVDDENNARSHDEKNLASIAASLAEFGQLKPIVVNANGMVIVAGHGTVAAAKRLNWTHVAAVVKAMTEADHRGFAIADNRTAELAEWDVAMLTASAALIAGENRLLYEELQLAEVVDLGEQNEPEEKKGVGIETAYQVVVECEGEEEQREVYEELTAGGRECRVLTI